MIIVTGATGQLGHQIVEQLLEKLPASEIGLSVRSPKKAATFANQEVWVRKGDFGDLTSLVYAFEGASQVLIISSNSSGESAVAHHRNAIEAAQSLGLHIQTSQRRLSSRLPTRNVSTE